MIKKLYIFIGPPGSGKGTVSNYLIAKYHFTHLAPGDVFRQMVKSDSQLGQEVRTYIDSGNLVPLKIVNAVMEKAILEAKDQSIVLDGYPRDLDQAISLNEILKAHAIKIDKVIYFEVDQQELIKRIEARLVCSGCGRSFSKLQMKTDICTVCKHKLIKRSDDNSNTFKDRLKVYQNKTEPLLSFYKENKIKIVTLQAGASTSKVLMELENIIHGS